MKIFYFAIFLLSSTSYSRKKNIFIAYNFIEYIDFLKPTCDSASFGLDFFYKQMDHSKFLVSLETKKLQHIDIFSFFGDMFFSFLPIFDFLTQIFLSIFFCFCINFPISHFSQWKLNEIYPMGGIGVKLFYLKFKILYQLRQGLVFRVSIDYKKIEVGGALSNLIISDSGSDIGEGSQSWNFEEDYRPPTTPNHIMFKSDKTLSIDQQIQMPRMTTRPYINNQFSYIKSQASYTKRPGGAYVNESLERDIILTNQTVQVAHIESYKTQDPVVINSHNGDQGNGSTPLNSNKSDRIHVNNNRKNIFNDEIRTESAVSIDVADFDDVFQSFMP